MSFEIAAGPDAGRRYRQGFTSGSTTPEFAVGDVVGVSRVLSSGRIVGIREVPCDFDAETICIEADVRICADTESGAVGTLLHSFKGGTAIGRAHVGSIVNTLVRAYLGAAMPLVILFILAQQSLGSVANGEVIAIEIVRSLVGTIGIVPAVPLTTWMAVV